MPVQAQWDDDPASNALIFTFEGDWTWFECREALQSAEFLAEEASKPVSHFYDLTLNRLSQRTYLPILQKLMTVDLAHPVRTIVIVERGHFVDTLRDMFVLAIGDDSRTTIHFAESIMRARVIARNG